MNMNTYLGTEITKIIEYRNLMLPKHDRKTKAALKTLIDATNNSYLDKTYDFSQFVNITLKQADKTRNVKLYKPFSSEEILCIYLKRLLDKTFHIKYPNRNVFMRSTFDLINSLKDMHNYTIFRFDFSDFFNSVSSQFVYEKYIKNQIHERYQLDLLSDFVNKTNYAYAGLNTSNIICEIVAKKFDETLLNKFANKGVILYKRYIDDGLIIFNEYISKDECQEIVNKSINEVFYYPKIPDIKQCKTKLNTSKTKHIAKKDLVSVTSDAFDFLGYKFVLKINSAGKTEMQFGITQKKIDKYTRRINTIVQEYAKSDDKNTELLRHQIKAFSHRTVYRVNRYKSIIWKNKGFISNYCELRYRMNHLTPETEKFMKDVIIKAFSENSIPPIYFMRGNKQESIYNLYNNMQKYRTLLFVEMIGISLETLKKMCTQVGIDINNKTYNELVREYLIKVKVGH